MDIPISLIDASGSPVGVLQPGARGLVVEAEQLAIARGLSKREAVPLVFTDKLAAAGFVPLSAAGFDKAARQLEAVRQGQHPSEIVLQVHASKPGSQSKPFKGTVQNGNSAQEVPMTQNVLSFFEQERVYPSEEAQRWYERLVGLDVHKNRLLVELELLLFSDRLEAWSKKHHGKILRLVEAQRHRCPLIILEGDVGTGKTALAETVGDALARKNGKPVHLLKINTRIRGSGQVGEMTQLIAQAFAEAERRARSLKGEPVLLLIDEADSLAESRETHQMHHEDKAGLNTLLQRLDNLRMTGLPLAALFITNRPDALDPAVRRRAALTLRFARPDADGRRAIFAQFLPDIALENNDLEELVRLTGCRNGLAYGFTASDITDRLLPGALRAAYPDRPLSADMLREQALATEPTPPFSNQA